MTPAEFVHLKFGPIFDRIEETDREIPEEMVAYLIKGALVEAMVARARVAGTGTTIMYVSDFFPNDLSATQTGAKSVRCDNPDAIFAFFTKDTDFIAKALGTEEGMQETPFQEARA